MALTMKKIICTIAFFIALTVLFSATAEAQSNLTLDFRNQMEIPGVVEVSSSPTHLYVLSEQEGLVVFRAHADSLQWLYTSTGMQRRGNKISADTRFAYLFGDSRRLTVIEPTSVLGVYSSTVLPERPRSAERIGDYLYIAFGSAGLGKLSLDTPESVDTTPDYIDADRFNGSSVNALASNNIDLMFVLSGNRYVHIYEYDDDSGSIVHDQRVELSGQAENIFLIDGELFASNRNGDLFMVDSDGQLRKFAETGTSVRKISSWNDLLVAQTSDKKLWVGNTDHGLSVWKDNERAGNHFTVVEDQFWVSEFNTFAPVLKRSEIAGDASNDDQTNDFKLHPIDDRIQPFPRPLIIPLITDAGGYSPSEISFSYEGTIDNARIRGNTFYWQPRASQTGQQQFTITATTADGQSQSVDFTVNLRPFNAPPRFSPSRAVTIPAESEFELEIDAHDPDGSNPDLIRYLGVDLPDGASLDEKTGVFRWTPNIRQVGEFSFRVIATDQFGAASSQDYEIRVIELDEDDDDPDFLDETES